MTTVEQLLTFLAERNSFGRQLSPVELDQLRSELTLRLSDIDVRVPGAEPGARVLFYSGALWDGNSSAFAWDVAEQIGRQSGGQVLTIGQTAAGDVLNDQRFSEALLRAVGDDIALRDSILYGSKVDGVRVPDGITDYLSDRFRTGNAAADVLFLNPLSKPDSVAALTELPGVLSDSRILTINGMPKEVFVGIYNAELTKGGTPNDFPCLQAVADRLAHFERYYESIAHPFEWKFTRADLNALIARMRSRYDETQHLKLAA